MTGQQEPHTYVVYTVGYDRKPRQFLSVADGRPAAEREQLKWQLAFESGVKQEPDEWAAIRKRPVHDFDAWDDGDADIDDVFDGQIVADVEAFYPTPSGVDY